MKPLLFDQNLSPRLVEQLSDLYPNSTHVEMVGLGSSGDRVVWEFARRNDLAIVSRDVDFSELSVLLGPPPKVVWIRRGNCSTHDIEDLLRENSDALNSLSDDPDAGILTVF